MSCSKYMPAPVCLIENDENGRLCVRKEAKDILDEINEPVVVVSVVGLYRTGKSYLMNHLAGQQSGFALGSTIESKTKGIWMWCVPHPNKEGHTLVLLDTEGLGDVAKVKGTVLSCIVFRVLLAEHIKIRSTEAADDEEEEEDSEFVRFFPSFIWVVRDFTLDLEIDGKKVTDDDYLEFALNLRKGVSKKIRDYNLPGECIKRYFPSRKCFVFPFPANSHQDMTRLEILQDQDLAQQFLEVTGHFCDYMFVNSDVKRLKGGHIVTGRLKLFIYTISSGEVPCLDNAVVVLANLENQTAVQEALKVYQGGMEELKKTLPISIEKLTCEHQKFSSLAIAKFTKRSFKDEKNEYLKTLEEAVSMCYTDLLEENKMASERKCRDLLKNLSSDMSKRLQDGEYSQSGGYELYCRDRDAIVEQYRREPNKGIRAEAVLEEFLKEREPEANSILCMDNKLTENEKQMNSKFILEEKENAALLKQKLKEEEEKRIESEKMMETEKVRHEDRVKQMQESFNKEKEQQQQEMDRAIESKLKEREEMLKKGFKDEAYNLKEEIKKLKDEKERSHGGGGIFKDYVMPFLCPLVETVPNLLMQRSMMKSLKKGLKC
uniref:Guanylate-binding protein 1-like n=1 Tax=Sinocyclocheilus anshuiensis TaxID=1608454 RepID=A0A671L2D3_9TELE